MAIKEGNASIPSQTFIWLGETLHREKTQALHNPRSADSYTLSNEVKNDKPWGFVILFAFILHIALYIIYPYIKRWREKQELAYIQSEEGRFKSLLDACEEGDVNTLYDNFYFWLQVSSPKLSRLGFRGIEEVQPSFLKSLRELETLLSSQQKTFDTIAFISELKQLRKTLLKAQEDNNKVYQKI
ncbi:hypothetical protein [Sulfurovum sp.]|uniref:hypothetical protein n=1 Tax=Sulfurovum sp. TaxID=1969726 RepID=UPI003563A38B